MKIRRRREVGTKVFELLLRLYPRGFRDRYGRALMQAYRDLGRDEPSHWQRLISVSQDFAVTFIRAWAWQMGIWLTASSWRSRHGGGEFLSELARDLKFGFRSLVRTPGFAATAVLTLALGIGANTAIFSVVNGVILKALPYHEPERLVAVWHRAERAGVNYPFSLENFRDWESQNSSFEGMAVMDRNTVTLTGVGEAERVPVALVSPNTLSLLGVVPWIGRGFTREDQEPGTSVTAILSHAIWSERFGSDSAVVGRVIVLDDEPVEVIGVAPPGFKLPLLTNSRIWMPLGRDEGCGRACVHYRGFARLAPGVTLAQARSDLSRIASALQSEYPGENTGVGVGLVDLHEQTVGDVRPALMVLMAAVGLVLLIACVNVANLFLARSQVRQIEMAVRSALGASRGRLIRQLLTESVLVSVVSAGIGLALAAVSLKGILAFAPQGIPRLDQIGLDAGVLAFTVGLAVLSAVLFGMVPALQESVVNQSEVLKEGGRGGSGTRSVLTRDLLVATEMALALTLLVGAGLLMKSFGNLLSEDPGIRPERVLTARVSVPSSRYGVAQRQQFYRELQSRLEAVPGVRSVGVTDRLPLTPGDMVSNLEVEGRPAPAPGEDLMTSLRVISPGYQDATGLPLIAGRSFGPQDHDRSPLVVLVSQKLAQAVWPDEDPLGQRVAIGLEWEQIDMRGDSLVERLRGHALFTVIGVVGDVRLRGLDDDLRWVSYLPHSQWTRATMSLAIETTGEPEAVAGALRDVVKRLDSAVPVSEVVSMNRVLAESVAQPRFNLLLLGSFAGLAVLLATVGIYGVMAYTVSRRTREIGVRIALGATRSDVGRQVISRALILALLGVGLGLAGALALTRLMQSMLYGVSPHDPVVLIAVAVLLAATAALASTIPALRAARVNPVVALREE